MNDNNVTVGNCSVEIISNGALFQGLGKITIAGVAVRSGRLPLLPYSESFAGFVSSYYHLLGISENDGEVRLQLQVNFTPMITKMMRDHSFDPIYELGDWGENIENKSERLDIVLRAAEDTFTETHFAGFSYHYEYFAENIPLFFLLDRASWEIGGDIVGANRCQSIVFFRSGGYFFR